MQIKFLRSRLIALLFLMLSWAVTTQGQEVTLNHNIGENIIDSPFNFTCGAGGNDWARVFVLQDFGISQDYTITRGRIGIQSTIEIPGPDVFVRIYEIDEQFPDSFTEDDIIGSSQAIRVNFGSEYIIEFDFDSPVVVPASVDRILVEVDQPFDGKIMFLGGTMDSFDFSWYKIDGPACSNDPFVYKTTFDLGRPDLNYFIEVTGDTILGIGDEETSTVTLSPNPAADQLKIRIPNHLKSNTFEILDIHGRIVMQSAMVEQLDISQLSSGMYFLQTLLEGKTIRKRFIKR